MKRLVSELIHQKCLGNFPFLNSSASINEALNLLESSQSSALLVVDDGKLQGIFSEKDFVKSAQNKKINLSNTLQSVMTQKVYYVEPDFNLEECLQLMSRHHVRHLPVLKDGRPIALLSMRHIMEVLIQDKESHIKDLMTYITGSNCIEPVSNHFMRNNALIYHPNKQMEAV